jgi:hypothetical protein
MPFGITRRRLEDNIKTDLKFDFSNNGNRINTPCRAKKGCQLS